MFDNPLFGCLDGLLFFLGVGTLIMAFARTTVRNPDIPGFATSTYDETAKSRRTLSRNGIILIIIGIIVYIVFARK
jgi:hypothetical protein